ncbi:MAG: PKD domain-containing protein [Bacteroidota bacterium]
MKKFLLFPICLVTLLLFQAPGLVMGQTCTVSVGASPSAVECSPQTITLTATPGSGTSPYTYLWNTAATTQTIIVSATGTYSVTVTDAASTPCTASNQISVLVNPAPVPAISGPSSVCAFSTGSSYSTPVIPGNTYQWNVTGGTISGSSTANPVTVNWGAAGSRSISVKETITATGCYTSASYNVTVTALPATVVTGQTCVCVNSTGIMYTTPNHVGNTYAWTVSGGTITAGQGTYQILVSWGNTPGPASVFVTETSPLPCSNTGNLNVTISPFPTSTFTITNNNVCSGTTVSFQTTVTGVTYLWNFGDPASGSANTSTLQNPGHIFNTYGCGTSNYNVTLTTTNPCGCSTTSAIQVANIFQQPNPQLQDQDIVSPFSNCDNNPTPSNPTFTLIVNNITQNQACITSYTINWGDGGGNIPYPVGFTTATHIYNSLGAFNLVITATSLNGCVKSTTYVVANQSNPAVGISAPGTTSGCLPATWSFTINGAGNNSPGTTYRIDWGDATSITKTNSELLADSIVPHTYTTSSCGQGLPQNQFNVKVTAINACDSTWALVSGVKVYQPPVAGFTTTPLNSGCINTPVCFTNTTNNGFGFACSPNTTYAWNFGDPASGAANTSTLFTPPCHTYSATGSYTISLTATNGPCSTGTTYTKVICINSPPNSSFTVDNTIGCSPVSVNATNTSTTPDPCLDLLYTWNVTFNGSLGCTPAAGTWSFANSTNAHTQDASFLFTGPGTYTITLAVQNSCSIATSTKIITVKTPPSLNSFALSPASPICAGQSVTPLVVFNNCFGTAGMTYAWTSTGGNPASATGNSPPPTITYSTPGSYNISVTAANECGTSSPVSSIPLIVNPIGQVNQPANQVLCNGASTAQVTFTTTNTGAGVNIYTWTNDNPGIGLAATGTGNIASFVATNTGSAPTVATVVVTPGYASGGIICIGPAKTFTITVNPTGQVNQPSNQVVCDGSLTAPVSFTTGNSGGTTTYAWTNNLVSIGLAAAGTGDIPAFTALNAGTSPVTATLIVTPTFAFGGISCNGPTKTFTITVNPNGQVNQPTDQVVCNTTLTSVSFVTVNTGGGTTYTWTNSTPAIGLPATGSGNISFTAVNTTTSPVTASVVVTPVFTNGGIPCNGSTKTFSITVNPTGQADQPANVVVCNGAVTAAIPFTTVNTGGVTTYSWNNNTSAIGLAAAGTGTLPSFTATNTGNVPIVANVVVTPTFTSGGISCPGPTKTFTITVNPSGQVNLPPNQSVCNNAPTAPVSFSTNNSGGVTTYSWTNNATSIGLAAGGTGDIGSFTATNTGTSPVVATIIVTPSFTNAGASCPGPSKTFTITVNPTGQVDQPVNQVVCNGLSTAAITFTTVNTGGATSYSWTNSTSAIGLAANGTGNIPSFTAVNTGLNPVVATIIVTPAFSNGGTPCSGSPRTFTITVNPAAQVNQPASQVVCNTATTAPVSFTTNNGVGLTTFTWTNSLPGIGLAASGTGDIPAFTATNATFSPVAATMVVTPTFTNGGNSCAGSTKTFTITVNPTGQMNQPADIVVCHNSVAAVSFVTNNTGGAVTYSWSNSNPSIGLLATGTGNISFVASNITVAPVTATITVTPTFTSNGVSCPGTASIFQITVNPLGQVNPPSNQVVCPGDLTSPVIFTTTNTGGTTTYTWTNNAAGIGLAATGTGNIAAFTAINATGAPVVATIQVTPQFLNGSVSCQGTPQSFTITVNPAGEVNQPVNVSVCNNSTATVNFTTTNTGGVTTYTWTNNTTSIGLPAAGSGGISFTALNTTTSPVTATLAVTPVFTNGGVSCTGTTKTFTITVNPTGQVDQPVSLVICPGPSPVINFTTVNTGGATTYTWTNNTPAIGLAGTGTGNISSFVAVNPGSSPVIATVTVIPVFANGSTSCPGPSKSFTITVNPAGQVNQPLNQVVCNGTSTAAVSFTTNNTGGTTTYTWTNNNASIGLAVSGSGDIPAFSAICTGAVPVVATIAVTPQFLNGLTVCSGTAKSFTITVNPLPVPTITGPTEACQNSTGNVYSTQPGMSSYSWVVSAGGSITSGGTTTSNTVTVTWNSPGPQTVSVNYLLLGCQAQASSVMNVTVNPLPTANAGLDQFIPYGTSTTLTGTPGGGTPGYTYLWQPVAGITGPNNTLTVSTINLTVSPSDYTFSVTDSKGCSQSDLVRITLSGGPLSVLASSVPATICNDGSGVQLNALASGGNSAYSISYSWTSVPAGFTSTLQNPTVNPVVTTIYTVTVFDGFNYASSPVTVTVNPMPVVYAVTGGGEYCSGGSGQPIGLSNSQAGVNYQLYLGASPKGAPVPGTNSSITFGNQTSAGTYTVHASYALTTCNLDMSGNAVIVINPLPVANAGTDQTINYGTPATLTGSATSGTPGFNYIWTPAGSINGSNTTATVNTLNLTVNPTTFTLNVTDSKGCAGSDQMIVHLNGGPLTVTASALPAVICNNGTPVQLNALASGGNSAISISYSWTSVPAGFTSTIQNPTVNPVVTTTYTVTVNDGFNTATNTAAVTVNPLPIAYAITGGGEYCSGGAGLPVGLANSQTGVNYQLMNGAVPAGAPVPGSGAAISFGNQTAAGTYTIQATVVLTGCTQTMTGNTVVTINPLPLANAGVDQTINYGTSTTLAGSAGSGTPPYNYSWIPVASISGSTTTATVTTQNLTVNPTTFTLNVTDNKGCTSSDQMIVHLNGGPLAVTAAATPQVICDNGAMVQLNATATGGNSAISISYSWSSVPVGFASTLQNPTVNPVISTVYTVTVNDGFNTASNQVSVTVNPLPSLYNVTGGGEYCAGGAGLPVGLSNSQAGVNYQLMLGASPVGAPVTGNGSPVSFGNQAAAGTYIVHATFIATGCNRDMTGSAVVTINPLPVANAGTDQTINFGTSTILVGTATAGTPGYSYTWLPSANINGSNTTATVITQNITTSPVTFTLNIIDSKGCTASDQMVVTLNGSALAVTATATPQVICNNGATVQLGASPAGGNSAVTATYSWTSVPAGFTSTLQNPTVNPVQNTVYTVVVNDGFNTATNQVTVTVNPLPAAFNVTGGGEYCSGGTGLPVGLSGSQNGISYQLFNNLLPMGMPVIGNGNPVAFGIMTAGGNYTVIATNTVTTCTNAMTGSAQIVINPLPTSNAGVDQSIAYGTSTLLAGSAGAGTPPLVYSWSPVVNISTGGTTLTPHTTNLYSTTTFTLQVTDSKGCTSSDNVIISLNGNPLSVSCTALPMVICNNGVPVQLNAVGAGGSGTYVYTWTSNPGSPPWSVVGQSITVNPVVSTVYTVTADDGFNTATNTIQVTVNPLPTVFAVTGGGEYCSGGSGVPIGLSNSVTGINYQLYLGASPDGPFVSGTGSPISFGNRTVAGTYTVRATNSVTTCWQNMTGSAVIIINPLPVVNAGTDKIIPFGISTTLNGAASGGTGTLLYSWSPPVSIASGGNTLSPVTTNLYANTIFTLTVSDSKSCVNSDQMEVFLSGNPLSGTASVAPSTICNGASAQLTSSGAGGSGSYTYTWSCVPPGIPAWSSTQQNPSVSPSQTTLYTVIVNDGYNTNSASATLTVHPLPILYNVTGGGAYCFGGAGVPVGLSGSEPGISYQLMLGVTPLLPPVTGNGSPITFGNQVIAGTYTIIATNLLTNCQNTMTGNVTVSVLPLPAVFNVTGGGSYANGGAGVPVGLSGSEVGIGYMLYLGAIPKTTLPGVPGNGNAITFGNQTAAGTYTVVATNLATGCISNMTGSATVIINPYPAPFPVFGGGPICLGDPGVNVGLAGSEIGVRYILYRNTDSIAGADGTGDTLIFGPYATAGTYTIKGINKATTLTLMMTGNAVIVVNPLPVAYLMVPQGDTCYGTEILINGSQAGINYYLIKGIDTISMVQGTGLFGLLTFGHQYDTGTYHVAGVNALTHCMINMTGTVTLHPAPAVFNVNPPGILCSGQTILLSGSATGINYQLIRNGAINVGLPLPGTGFGLNFGPQYLPGVYTVVATNPLTHCYSWMNGNATIQPPPVVYNILPSGDTCAPAIVRLNGSQVGISYRLLRNSTIQVDSLYGTGQPLLFGTYQTAGVYRIIAIDTLTHCEFWMADSLRIYPAPIKYNITPNGIACANSVIGLDNSQVGVFYTLIRNGSIIAAGPIPGAGGPITFGFQPVAGSYTVDAVFSVTGCHAVMNGTAVLNPLPLIYQIAPQGSQCAGTDIYLNGSQPGVNYTLLRNGIAMPPARPGTGAILDFGFQSLPGNYTIKAVYTATTCDTLMGGSTTITPGPVAFGLTPIGISCSPVTIGLNGSVPGITYQLRRDSLVNVGPAITGTGSALNFGAQTQPGVYSIVAYNPATLCYSWMTGRDTIQIPPLVYDILPSGDTCSPAIIRLNGSQPGKLYRLVLNGTIYLNSMMGNGSPLVFGTFVTSGVYRIRAVDVITNCEYPMADSVRILDSPIKYNVIPNGVDCANMAIGLDGSDPGVAYTLIRNGSVTAAGPVTGNGSAINFGPQSYPGTYTVIAFSAVSGCHSIMNGTAVLNPAPASFLVEPPGNQCPGTDIYINGSQTGVNYQLLRNNILTGPSKPGTNAVIHFGKQYLTGTYTVKAVNSVTNCDTVMTGATIIVQGPVTYNVTPAGANCSPSVVGLSGSEIGVNYELFRNGFAILGPVPGTGNPLSFGLQSAGTYIVIGTGNTSLCADTMSGPAIVTAGPLAHAGNDTAICASHTLQLGGHATDYSAINWLTMGDGTFTNPAILNPVYTPGPADTVAGLVRLILFANGSPACLSAMASDTMVLTINAFPIVDAGADDTICSTQTASLNGIVHHTSTVHWTTTGDGTFNNANIAGPLYTPGIFDKLAGHVILRLKVHGSASCQADTLSDFMNLYIQPLPIAAAGPDDTICENWSYTLSGAAQHQSSVTWTTLGDGSFNNPSLLNASYTPGTTDRNAGSVRLILTAHGLSHCSSEVARDTMKLLLNKLPAVNVGPDTVLCANQPYHVFATVQRNSDLLWTTTGDGTFNNIHTLNPVYTPGALDIITGSVMLKLSVHGILSCVTESVADSMMLSIFPMPVANAGNDTLSCPNIAIPLHGAATHYTSVLWNTLGDGTFDNPALLHASYTPGLLDIQHGFANLVLTAGGQQQCGSQVDNDTVRVNFKPLPTVSLSGSGTICEDSTGVVIMNLTGVGPWNVVYTDGLNNFTISNIAASPYNLTVSPIITTTYTILSVSDGGCSVIHTGPSFTVTVNPKPNTYAMNTTGGGGYCEGGAGVDIGIDGSQSGVFYQLLLGGAPSGLAMPGNGSPISFGLRTVPGVYQVKAWHPQTMCTSLYPDSVVVVIFAAPRVDFTSDSACFGFPTQFHLTGLDINKIATWQWHFGDGTTATYTAPIEPQHTYPATGNYVVTLIVTDTNYCTKTFIHNVTVNELPVALFSHDAPMCVGYPVHFTDNSYSPGNNYIVKWHWEFGDGADTIINWPAMQNVTHIYTSPNTYSAKLTVTTNRGCTAVKVRPVQIMAAPTSNFTFSGACEKELVQFTDISQLNGGGSIVEWKWNFGDPSSGINNTAIIQSPQHLFDTTGVYHVTFIVMNSGGCTDTIKKTVSVQKGPVALFTYNTACLGSATQFTDASTPNATSDIEWHWNFGDGSAGSSSQNPTHTYANAGVYQVTLTVKNSNFCSHDTTLQVSIYPLPSASYLTDAPLCHSMPVTFTNTSTTQHGQVVSWVWDFGDGTTSTILFPANPNVTHTFSGTSLQHLVRLTIKTSDSCSSFVEHLINSVSGPLASFDFSTALCPGVNVQFTDLSQQNGGGPITFWHWNFSDALSGSSNNSTLQNPVHAFSGQGSYNVKMVIGNAGNCKDSLVKQVIIGALPLSAFTFDTVCLGSVTHFTDQSTTNPGTLLTWDWDFGDGQPHANTANAVHLYTAPGPFTVTLTVMNSGYCVGSVSHLVHVNPAPLALFSNSTINCTGSSVSFIDQSTTTHGYILQWHWNFGDGHDTLIHFPGMSPVYHTYATGGVYNATLTVKTSDSCSSTVSNAITVYNKPMANFSFSAANCQMAPVQFTDLSQTNGSGVINSWSWDFGDPGSGVNNQSTLQNPLHSFQNSGPYTVHLTVKNGYLCTDSISKPLTISANPVAAFTADTVCRGTLTHFSDASTTTSGTITNWLWDFGDGSAPGTTQNPDHLYAASGTYTVLLTVHTSFGCQHSVTHQAVVKVIPTAMFTSVDHCVGGITHFTDQSTTPAGGISGWTWTFGDGSGAATQDPTHVYASPGSYNVKLVVTNTAGCTDSVTIPLTILQRPKAAFSYFSPNCPAGKVTFTDHSTPAGSPVNSWKWILTPTVFSTDPNPSYTYTPTNATYPVTLIVRDQNGCYDTIDSTVFVRPGFSFTFHSDSSCLGNPTHFQPVNLAAGDTLHDLHWNFGEASSGINNTSTLYDPVHTYANAGSYIVKLKAYNADNCSDSIYKEVVVHPLPIVSYTNNQGAHCDSIITFTNHSVGNGAALDSLAWKFGDGSDTTFVPGIPTVIHHRYPGFGLFHVTVTAYNHHGCQQTDSSLVNVACISASVINRDTVLCQRTRMYFADSSHPVNLIKSWHWFFGDTRDTAYTKHCNGLYHTYPTAGTYTVSLVVTAQSNGSVVRDTSRLQVVVRPGPLSDFRVAAVCSGDTSRFINLSDSGAVHISSTRWNFGDIPSGAKDTTSILNPEHYYLLPGKHKVRLVSRNDFGCSDTVTRMAVVHTLPKATFTTSAPCARYDISFQDKTVKGDTTLARWWWLMGNPMTPYDTLFTKNVTYRIDSVGTYLVFLKVKDNFGCTDTVLKPVTIQPSPLAAFTITENYDGRIGMIKLNNQSSADAKAFKWTFGNGKTSTEVNPTATYTNDNTVYRIELVTWNTGLCYDTTYLDYEFFYDNLFVPNAFAPTSLISTGNALEIREFKPKGLNLKDYHLMIFDKWGHMVFESSKLDCADGVSTNCKGSPVEGWDGTFNGELLPQDVYMWKISATFRNGKVWEGSNNGKGTGTTMGTVTLIR